MDNYFILSSNVGDKWTKVTSDMTSVKLGTCIHIMGKLISRGIFTQRVTNKEGGETSRQRMISFEREFIVIPKNTHSVIQSMTP